jgi:D-sedoheptulose 7-phosphate isomerase
MNHHLQQAFNEHHSTLEQLLATQSEAIERIGERIVATLRNGGKILSFGNGGSAADAEHLACELLCRFEAKRRALPAIALTGSTAFLTATANDLGFEQGFARAVEALALSGDLCAGISTSGISPNVIEALRRARELGAVAVGLTGRDGGRMREVCDDLVIVPHDRTCRIQEAHEFIIHVWCAMIDEAFAR